MKRIVLISAIVIIAIPCLFLVNNKLGYEELVRIHIEKEKRNGDYEINQQLYAYKSVNGIDKYILTDYQYLWILPEIDTLFIDGQIQYLDTEELLLNDPKVGFLLWTPSNDVSRKIPDIIEAGISSGRFTEVFSIKGYRFIKIR